MSENPLGLIAGGGQFPFLVARAARQSGLKVACTGFMDNTDLSLESEVDFWQLLHLGQLNKLISFFKKACVRDIIFAGSIDKPRALDIRPDFRAVRLLFRIKSGGDDALLRVVAGELESEGFEVVSALSVVPQIATPAGVLTSKPPRAGEWEDLRYGWSRAKAIGAMDIGQSLIIKNKMVIAVEGPEGTDAALRRAGGLAGKGCVLCKVYKPEQDNRLDLPAVGLGTIEAMIETGASCLGIEAGRSLFFDLDKSIDLAHKHGIRIVGLTEPIADM